MDASGLDELPARGVIKWFDCRKGFGFILDRYGQEVFVHHSVIEGTGFRSLREGQKVAYAVTDGPKGLLAVRLRPLTP